MSPEPLRGCGSRHRWHRFPTTGQSFFDGPWASCAVMPYRRRSISRRDAGFFAQPGGGGNQAHVFPRICGGTRPSGRIAAGGSGDDGIQDLAATKLDQGKGEHAMARRMIGTAGDGFGAGIGGQLVTVSERSARDPAKATQIGATGEQIDDRSVGTGGGFALLKAS